ncbi:seipin-like isoform X2 [Eleginops maclovinus]|uniref:seipin-like isoform X2 n=1 Tax=Eleginops maclovinus TaxID=56733 RepID=UPI003080C19C
MMGKDSDMRPGDGDPSPLIVGALLGLKDAVVTWISRARQIVIRGFALFSIVFLLLWIAAFLYGSFYYSYMPKAVFSTPVHYHYRTDCESPASFLCSYPVANISLMRNSKHVLTFGQAYQMSLQLDMPDSPTNQELGMFMIKTTCFSREGGQVASSARSARQLLFASSSRFSMLRYRSELLRSLGTLLFFPAFLTGVSEQKQMLEVELFSDYTDDPYLPSASAIIEILSSKVQIYSSQLYVHAHFTGISLLFVLSYVKLLFKEDWAPVQLRTDGGQNNHQEDESDAAEGTAEMVGPFLMTPQN